jgi:hypothetical protein
MEQQGLDREYGLKDAAAHLRAALEIVDAGAAPAHIGAHIDLALCELEIRIAQGSNSTAIARQAFSKPQNCSAA